MALCRQGDEAVAVGLVAEGLPDDLFGGGGDGATDSRTVAPATAVLRKVTRRETCAFFLLYLVLGTELLDSLEQSRYSQYVGLTTSPAGPLER